jgi:ATPase subunit of ABC transporter with duplicated ATPase domains
LQNVTVKIPLGTLTCVTGVSGSGKSSLINQTLYPILNAYYFNGVQKPLPYKKIKGLDHLDKVIEIDSISKSYDDKLLFENLSLSIPKGAIVGIIGGNGSGKSTLFRIITGQEEPDSGSVTLGDSVQLAYVDQSRDALDAKKSIWQEISDGLDILVLGEREVNSRAYCSRFNFSGSDQQKSVGVLSGGERNRVHLAKLLKTGGNVLLLDEPTNDLDVNTLRALEDAILDFAGCVLVISHDRWFLDRICTHIIAYEGDSSVVMVEGNFQDYEEDKKKRLGADAIQPTRVKYRKISH